MMLMPGPLHLGVILVGCGEDVWPYAISFFVGVISCDFDDSCGFCKTTCIYVAVTSYFVIQNMVMLMF
jgi:hypothetical protein